MSVLQKAGFSPTSLVLHPMPFEEWEAIGEFLQDTEEAHRWWVGDWLNFGEGQYGEKYSQAVRHTGNKNATLVQYASVARHVPPALRKRELSWTHHRHVAFMCPSDQNKWLKWAIENQVSSSDLKKAIKEEQQTVDEPSGGGDDCTQAQDDPPAAGDEELLDAEPEEPKANGRDPELILAKWFSEFPKIMRILSSLRNGNGSPAGAKFQKLVMAASEFEKRWKEWSA